MWYLPKDYVWVHTRVQKFHDEHEQDISIDTNFELHWKTAIFKAVVKTKKWTFSGSSLWDTWQEKALEKLETVAVGRALAFAGYEVKDWIASKDEMDKFESNNKPVKYFNYQDLVDTVEAWNTTWDEIKQIIKQDGFTVSPYAAKAIKHYLETWEIDKNLFYKQSK